MCADVSITVYNRKKGKTTDSKKHEFKEMSKEEIERKRKEVEERLAKGTHIVRINF